MPQHIDLALRRMTIETNQPQPAMEGCLRASGLAIPVLEQTANGMYKVEREILDTHRIIPLLYLPLAYAVSGRVT